MRLLSKTKWLALGGAAIWATSALVRRQQSSANVTPQPQGVAPDDLAPDPDDPVQGLDEAPELRVAEFNVDALSQADVDAMQDLAVLETTLESRGGIDEMPTAQPKDAGELYGVHTIPALDRDIPDNDVSYEVGENWIESLQASSTEYGPADPEDDIDVEDEMDDPPHPSDMRDIPVADRGSAGPRGL